MKIIELDRSQMTISSQSQEEEGDQNHVTFDSNAANCAGLLLHHNDNCSRVMPYFFPYVHVTERSNYKIPQQNISYCWELGPIIKVASAKREIRRGKKGGLEHGFLIETFINSVRSATLTTKTDD